MIARGRGIIQVDSTATSDNFDWAEELRKAPRYPARREQGSSYWIPETLGPLPLERAPTPPLARQQHAPLRYARGRSAPSWARRKTPKPLSRRARAVRARIIERRAG